MQDSNRVISNFYTWHLRQKWQEKRDCFFGMMSGI